MTQSWKPGDPVPERYRGPHSQAPCCATTAPHCWCRKPWPCPDAEEDRSRALTPGHHDNGRGRDAPKARGGPGIGITKTEGPPATVSVPYVGLPTGTVWCSRNCGWSVPYGDGAVDLIVAHLRSAHPETTEKGGRGILAAVKRWAGFGIYRD